MDVEIKIVVADVSHDYTRYRSTSFVTIGSGGSNGISKQIEGQLRARVDFGSQRIKVDKRDLDSRNRAQLYASAIVIGKLGFMLPAKLNQILRQVPVS